MVKVKKIVVLALLLVLLLTLDFVFFDIRPNVSLSFFGLLGGIVQAGASLANTDHTNEANLRINQMNNDFNAKEAEKARKWEEYMYDKTFNKEAEYNSASAQRKRLEEAGMNPYMNNVEAGSATGSTGSGTAATSSGNAHMMPADLSGLGAISSIPNELLTLSQAQKTGVEASNYSDLMHAQISKILGDVNWRNTSPEVQSYLRSQSIQYAGLELDSLENQVSNQKRQGSLLDAQIASELLDANAQRIINKYLDQSEFERVNIMAATYFDLLAHEQVNYEQARKAIAERIKISAEAKGQQISNKIAEQTADSFIRAQNNANDYQGSLDFYEGQYAREEAEQNVRKRRIDDQGRIIDLDWHKYNYEGRKVDRAIQRAGNVVGGISQGVGAYNDYLNGRHYRSRPERPDGRRKATHRRYSDDSNGYDEYYDY